MQLTICRLALKPKSIKVDPLISRFLPLEALLPRYNGDTSCKGSLDAHSLWLGLAIVGMTTGWIRAGFFHTWIQPAGQDPWPEPDPFRVPGFFPGPKPAPAGPRLGIGPNSWPNQKKKKFKPRFIFSYVQAQIYFCRSSLHIPNKKN